MAADILTHNEEAIQIAAVWEEQAKVVETVEPASPAARTLRLCAKSLRQWAQDAAPDEVPLSVVQDRTGWSDSWLRKRVQELAAEGRARKRGRTWWIDREAALDIPVKAGHRPHLDDVQDLDEMAERILDMQTS